MRPRPHVLLRAVKDAREGILSLSKGRKKTIRDAREGILCKPCDSSSSYLTIIAFKLLEFNLSRTLRLAKVMRYSLLAGYVSTLLASPLMDLPAFVHSA